MSKKNFNCSKCNFVIFPPDPPKNKILKDEFNQIRCLACGEFNNYFQSQWYEVDGKKVPPPIPNPDIKTQLGFTFKNNYKSSLLRVIRKFWKNF